MTPSRLRQILALTPLSQRQLALWLDVDDGTVRSWATGRRAIDPWAGVWLELLAHFLANHPPPTPPRRASP